MPIRKAAVLGAGRMGSAIAAHMANAGTEVILLDIVPEDAGNRRNKLAEEAVEKMLESERSPLTYPDHAGRIFCGNFEDDMERLKECDWIIEAVVEDPAVKKELFKKVDKARRRGSIVSSNTSTLPLRTLKEGLSNEMKNDMVITHFFNPPRQMRLLEFVTHKAFEDDPGRKELFEFADTRLGKTIVEARDTPGFIGNRLGLYWMLEGLQQALEKAIPVTMADAVFGKKLGFPKTGIFGLFDLVGVSLMRDLGHSLRRQLPQEDAYHALDRAMDFLDNMQEPRFYRREDGKLFALNLDTGVYEDLPDFQVDKDLSLSAVLVKDNQAAHYARAVLLRTMNYACACLPDIAESVADADTAMRLGFNWEMGPFEMIDTLGDDIKPGTARFIDALENNGLTPAAFLQRARTGAFYHTHKGKLFYLIARDGYKPKTVSADKWMLEDIARGADPALANEAARLWDVGDGIACLELTAKMGTIDNTAFDLIEEAMPLVAKKYKGLIIGHDHPDFSAGLNLKGLLKACENENWEWISAIVRRGQKTMMYLKKSPFPVVGAPSGKALGGACEMLLHCDGIQAHIESQIGLVETRIGLVPGWGGCKEMLARHLRQARDDDRALLACGRLFDDLAVARVSSSAEKAREQLSFIKRFGITMNRDRLLADAKKLCFSLAANYTPREKESVRIPAGAGALFAQKVEEMGNLSAHRLTVLRQLAYVLSGGGAGGELEEGEILNLEHDAFMALVKDRETQELIRLIL